MSDLDRHSIRPAHPQATIPDPDHRDDLPAEGRDVVWSSYWASHLAKGNVELVVAAAPAAAGLEASLTQASDAAGAQASTVEMPTAPAADAGH